MEWCKQRAREYLDKGRASDAWASMASDLGKHDETRGHIGLQLGMMKLMWGQLDTVESMREFIEGFN